MFSFIDDEFMPPNDPRGRNGPTLEQFLRFPTDEEVARELFARETAAAAAAAGIAVPLPDRSPYQRRGGGRGHWRQRGRSQSPPSRHTPPNPNPMAGAAAGAGGNPYASGLFRHPNKR